MTDHGGHVTTYLHHYKHRNFHFESCKVRICIQDIQNPKKILWKEITPSEKDNDQMIRKTKNQYLST